jgi:hypothetical protein
MRQRIIVFLLLFCFTSPVFRTSFASVTENDYGKFVETKNQDEHIISFILNPTNEKFKKVQEVAMFDYSNDEEGDISIVLYKKGEKEVFFRNRRNYWRYVSDEPSADVCGGDWSPKIVYRHNAWECSEMNFFMRIYMWRQIDNGLADAKREDWGALAERILENIKKIIKK